MVRPSPSSRSSTRPDGGRLVTSRAGLAVALACEAWAFGSCGGGHLGGNPCRVDSDCPDGKFCGGQACVPYGDEEGCMDRDGDGRGEGCRLGPDCNDTDSLQGGLELCGDRRDNDC